MSSRVASGLHCLVGLQRAGLNRFVGPKHCVTGVDRRRVPFATAGGSPPTGPVVLAWP